MQKIIKENFELDKILPLFSYEVGKHAKYQFNPEKKHNDILINDKIGAKVLSGYSCRVALLDPPIRAEKAKTFRKSISFKMVHIAAVIGIGVCYTKKV